ncbi:unnamed protein product [Cylicocyclus nassatus]|uniref:Translation initiation factor eIF2B subunit gamma n=1 Tax=Cylicocyclus nassatus TaxID=53992 RepID=A0AA36HCZ7_CYLNA|nr:unnamed protein product [Cylicocyclus nassatus]
MTELQAVLLCGGSGSRMMELCDGMFKFLLPIADVPMFWYPLNTLVNSGIKDVKIFVREDAEAEVHRLLKTPLFSFPSASLEVVSISRENEDWGTADVLRHYSSKITRDFVVMSCDFITDARLQPMIDQFRAHKATLLCLLSDMCATGPVPGPKVRRGKGRDFIAMEESTNRLVYMTSEEDFDQPVNAEPWMNKFSNVSLTARYVDCHVYFMRHSCLGLIAKQKNFASLKADFVPYLLSQQYTMPEGDHEEPKCMAYLLPHGNATVAAHANNLGAYFEVNKSILKSLPRISPKLYVGQVFDGKSTGIHTNESLVAEDAKIGERSLIKRSVIGSRCCVGEKANVQGSLVMDGASIGKGAKITQSIICCGASIGDNAELTSVIVAKDQKVSAHSKLQNEFVDLDDEDNAWENGL